MSIVRTAGALVILSLVTACSPITRVHGYVPSRDDLDLLTPGVDTQASVADTLGSPVDNGLTDDSAWFYMASTVETLAWQAPKVTERQVIVLDFNAAGILTEISEYGLEDGRVVALQPRVTPTEARRISALQQLLGNAGNFTLPVPQ